MNINYKITNFFNTYNSIIDAKLNNGDYTIKYKYITIKINDKFDIKLYPFFAYFNSDEIPMLEITIIRYADITGYARKYDIYNNYRFLSQKDNDEFNLYSLYYSKSKEIYSTLNIPKNMNNTLFSIFDNISNDIRIEKIEN